MIEDFSNNYPKEVAKRLFPLLEELCPYGLKDRKNGKFNQFSGYKELAIIEANKLMLRYPDYVPDADKTYNAAYGQINKIRHELKKLKKTNLKDAAFKYSIDTLIKNFTVELYSLFAVYRKRYNQGYLKEVKGRTDESNRMEINPSLHLQKAKDILSEAYRINLGQSSTVYVWQDIACAVALCSGRRMSEIFLTGKFEKAGEYELNFSGQCKGKSRKEEGVFLKDVVFTIPTLVAADLVLAGIEWLDNNGRRLDPKIYETSDVNDKYSKGLSRRSKDQWNMLPEGQKEKSRFHFFRAIYFICCSKNYEVGKGNLSDSFRYAQKILGDNDQQSIDAYSRFTLEDCSLTKL